MAAPTCTDCTKRPLEFHCDATQCTWWTCPSCGAVYDVDRGYRITRRGDVESTAD